MTSIDEAIQHCLEVAEERDNDAIVWEKATPSFHKDMKICEESAIKCRECATEHRQLAEWLTDYKRQKKKEEPKKVVVTTNPVGWEYYYCPSCDSQLYRDMKNKYCPKCGQALKWEDEGCK